MDQVRLARGRQLPGVQQRTELVRTHAAIVEINPYLNASGVKTSAYVNPPDAGYTTVNPANSNLMKEKKNISKQVVWNYSSKNNTSFYSTIGSSAQRLPNGNTFICAMNSGHFFEVSPSDTSIVWEYINPFTRSGIRKIKTDTYPTDNAAFRAYRYTADHPALMGHDLTPGATMTGFDPDYLIPANIVAIKKMTLENPVESSLEQNYPNPFNATTTIDFKLETEQHIRASVYDLSGKIVKTLADRVFSSGENSLQWDGTDEGGTKVPRGLYFYVLRSKDRQMSKKMIYKP
jgi:hypothetical protein